MEKIDKRRKEFKVKPILICLEPKSEDLLRSEAKARGLSNSRTIELAITKLSQEKK